VETKVITIVESSIKSGAKGNYLLVTDHEGVKFSCFQEHKGLWGSLYVNAVVTVSYEEVGKYKNIMGVLPMGEQIQVNEAEITKQQVKPISQPKETIQAPAPQAVGMCTKEIGDMIRSKYLKPLFGEAAYFELIKWYRGQVLSITRIPYDGSKLPNFETKKEE